MYSDFSPAPPPELNGFGYLPDLGLLQRGDIVLVRPTQPPAPPQDFIRHCLEVGGGSVAWYIQKVQERLRQPPHSRWIHVGLYLGNDLLLEAVTPRVTIRALSRYSPTHFIRVRRREGLSPEDQYRVCLHAARWVGDKYDVAGATGLARGLFGLLSGGLFKAEAPEPTLIKKSLICSELVHKAFLYGLGIPVGHAGGVRTPTPADLSETAMLQDVNVGWRKLG